MLPCGSFIAASGSSVAYLKPSFDSDDIVSYPLISIINLFNIECHLCNH